MNEIFWVIGLTALWLLLQMVILPKLGIDT